VGSKLDLIHGKWRKRWAPVNKFLKRAENLTSRVTASFSKIFRCVRKIAKIYHLLRHVSQSVRPSAWNNSAPTGRIFMKFDFWVFFEKSVQKIQVSLKSDKNNGYKFNIHGTVHRSMTSSNNQQEAT